MSREGWDRFWFAPGSSENLGRLRILFGLILVMKLVGFNSLARLGEHQLRTPALLRMMRIPGPFTLPVPGFEWLPMPSYPLAAGLDWALLGLTLLFTCGVFTRWVGVLIAGLIAYPVLLSQFAYTHHVNVLLWTALILCFSPCGDHYSVDAWRRSGPAPERPMTALRMLQILTTTIYFSTVLGKLNAGWFDGRMMEMMASNGHLSGAAAPWILSLVSTDTLGHVTLFVQGFLVFALWFPRTRRLGIWLGLLFHLGIDLMMPVTTFSYQMWMLYVAFIDPQPRRHRVTLPAGHWLLRAGPWLDLFKRVTWSTGGSELVLEKPAGNLRGRAAWLELGCTNPITFLWVWPLNVLHQVATLRPARRP